VTSASREKSVSVPEKRTVIEGVIKCQTVIVVVTLAVTLAVTEGESVTTVILAIVEPGGHRLGQGTGVDRHSTVIDPGIVVIVGVIAVEWMTGVGGGMCPGGTDLGLEAGGGTLAVTVVEEMIAADVMSEKETQSDAGMLLSSLCVVCSQNFIWIESLTMSSSKHCFKELFVMIV
jgi:hypothetical protein